MTVLGRLARAPAGIAVASGTASAFLRCACRTARLGWRGELHLSDEHLGWTLVFDDGASSSVYRESVCTAPRTGVPCLLVVAFKLRFIGVNPLGHAAFRAESLLNTPLFAGFPGFRSKLWLTDAGTGVYRGVYEWDGPASACTYAQTLGRLLRLVSVPGTVRHHVVEGVTPAQVMARPSLLGQEPGRLDESDGWWRMTRVEPAGGR